VKYLFGPVPSRRLGSSLGVDMVPPKVCSFDCIYCQLGRTTEKIVDRKEYVPVSGVLSEIKDFVESGQECDYITLSGSGEPTLNSGMGEIIKGIKSLTVNPVAVLTNASLITDSKVREELGLADLIVPSLDAATQLVFEKLNRPHPRIKVEDIIVGLTNFTRSFETKVWLEVMLVEGINDAASELSELRHAIEAIRPDKVQLNTVVRPPAEEYARPLTQKRLDDIAGILDAEVIADFSRRDVKAYKGGREELIVNLLKRRPCTISDISSALGFHENEVVKYVEVLGREGVIAGSITGNKKYFRYVGGL